MPLPLLAAAGIGAGGTLLSGLASSVLSNKAAKQMAELSYQHDLDMWNKNNEYNTPANQMKRYTDAGLNPNLIYGNGSASAGNSTSVPHYQPPQQKVDVDLSGIAQGLSLYQDYQVKQAQIDNLKAGTKATIQKTANDALTNVLLGVKGNVAKETESYQIDAVKQALYNAQETWHKLFNEADSARGSAVLKGAQVDTEKQKLQNLKAQANIYGKKFELMKSEQVKWDYENKLRNSGVNPNDELWQRLLAQFLNKLSGGKMSKWLFNP